LPYDAGQARQLLAEAGYPGGRGFPDVHLIARELAASRCEYLQAQWRENLGIEITWETMELPLLLARIERDPPPMSIVGWMADYPDPDSFLRTSPVRRHTRWRNETYDRLLEEARRLTDQSARMKLYRQADRILVEEAPIMPLIHLRWHMLVKPWVRRFPVSPIGYFAYKDAIIEPH
jgi:oligopeptide transport system substrate-binding protein